MEVEDQISDFKPLSEEEKKDIQAIKDACAEELKEAKISEMTIIRFLRGYAKDKTPLQTSISKLKACIAWRKAENVDNILNEELPGFDLFKQMWPSGIGGQDKQGHPIYWERVGQTDPAAVVEKFTIAQLKRFHIRLMEELTQWKDKLAQETGKQLYKHVVVLDMDGFGLRHMGSNFKGIMKEIVDIDQNFYPETLLRMFITNAPFLFRTLFAIVKPWLDAVVVAKIKMNRDRITEYVEIANIPVFLLTDEEKALLEKQQKAVKQV